MTLFDWLNEIRVGKRDWNSFSNEAHKTFQPYMINRLLSMDKDLIHIVNFFQKYTTGVVTPEQTYKFYCTAVPRGRKFNKYIKSTKSKQYKEKVVASLKNYYEVSTMEIQEYIDILSQTTDGKKQLKEITRMYGNATNKL